MAQAAALLGDAEAVEEIAAIAAAVRAMLGGPANGASVSFGSGARDGVVGEAGGLAVVAAGGSVPVLGTG